MNKSIDCQLKKVIDLLNNKDQYIMPDFQRGFVWGKMKLIPCLMILMKILKILL